jgi:hypothetical protein
MPSSKDEPAIPSHAQPPRGERQPAADAGDGDVGAAGAGAGGVCSACVEAGTDYVVAYVGWVTGAAGDAYW